MILQTSTEKGNRSIIGVSRSANAHIGYSLQWGLQFTAAEAMNFSV